MHGIATTNPHTVVKSASQIPPARSDGLGAPSNASIPANATTIPVTVPNNPTNGAKCDTAANTRNLRSTSSNANAPARLTLSTRTFPGLPRFSKYTTTTRATGCRLALASANASPTFPASTISTHRANNTSGPNPYPKYTTPLSTITANPTTEKPNNTHINGPPRPMNSITVSIPTPLTTHHSH